jgi:DnaJ-class molecular chaperone
MRGRIQVEGSTTCPRCRGTGEVVVNTKRGEEHYPPCPDCFGNGSVEKHELMEAA